jgi:UDP-N-acetylglucosamine 2-epimerase (hydrolysing)
LKEKKILFITGTRADYGKIEPLAKAAQKKGFDISFFITGMHMMKQYGETKLEVKKFFGAEFFEFVNQKSGDSLEFILSKTITGFSDFVHEHRPDLVIIHGDRVEALATSIVCAMKYIPSAHIEGGEVSGTIDESIRHCNTKLCSTHFVCSEAAKKRVLKLGEKENTVFNIGSPELDTHSQPSGVSIKEVRARYEIKFNDYGVVIFHPVVSEIDTIGDQAISLFNCLNRSHKNFVVILPNNDPGTDKIFLVLNQLPKDRFQLIPSMRFNYFSELLKNASALIGNSSSGVREAPFLGLPSLDIGTRQSNRAISSSITACSAFDTQVIENFIKDQWGKHYETSNEFGTGNSAEKFVSIILDANFWTNTKQKFFVDNE